MYDLRPYQAEAKQAVLDEWDAGRQKTLLVLPTGTGKTVVFASIAQNQVNQNRRVLIMAHRGELLEQASAKLKAACGIDTVLEKAESSSLGSNIPVTVGSIQSLAQVKRLDRFPTDYFNDIIVDEAHHSLSDSYQRVLQHFHDANVLGVTATPDRGDMKNLGTYFDSLAYEYSMLDAVKDGYLCTIKAQMCPLQLDISDVDISSGDYAVGGIGHALEPYLSKIAKEMTRSCWDRKTVVFLPLISTSQKFCAELNAVGFKAAEVNGNSPDRAEILADFEAGKYNVLCNSMLLTEGWDCPSVDCIVVLRPTKIRSLYQQMVGRGTRIAPGKTDLLLLDFLWMTGKHSLCRPASLVCKSEETAERVNRIIANGDKVDLFDADKQAQKDVVEEREQALAKQLEENRHKKAQLVDPLQFSVSIFAPELVNYVPSFAWESKQPTEKQLAFLEKRGLSAENVTTAGMAHELISRLVDRQENGLTTPKQIRVLERYGFEHVGTWTFEKANSLISVIAANKWRVPRWINPGTYKA